MSRIVSFFKNKTVFITGATGFVGKLTLEQLLRKCEPKKVYVLVRSKRGMDPKVRMQKLFEEQVFDKLKSNNSYYEKVEVLNGELVAHNLGLSEELLKRIVDETEIVLHGAATVKFNEHIRIATNINVKGTISVIKLCQQMKNLKAFMHISTAFANCPNSEIKEEFEEVPIDCDELVNMVDKLTDDQLTASTNEILGKWPNTYTFTKAVAENAIQQHAKNLPVGVFRPSMIVCTYKEPFPSWVDNAYGPLGYTTGMALGAVRVIGLDDKHQAEIVPGDMVASGILAATYKISLERSSMKIPIFNFVANETNIVTWHDFFTTMLKYIQEKPPAKLIFPPQCHFTKSTLLSKIYRHYYEILPMIITKALQATTKSIRRVAAKIEGYRNLVASTQYFAYRTWTFEHKNVDDLWKDLNNEDRRLFNLDMSSIDWRNYLKICYDGVRQYILKESPDNLEFAIRRYKRYKTVLRFMYTLPLLLIFWFIYSQAILSI